MADNPEDDDFDEDEDEPDAVGNDTGPASPELAPDGIALFPMIPEELGIHPLLLAVVHAFVFLDGSDAPVVNGIAADEALEYMVHYLQRLTGPVLKKVTEDIDVLVGYAKQEKLPKVYVAFLKSFLADNGIE